MSPQYDHPPPEMSGIPINKRFNKGCPDERPSGHPLLKQMELPELKGLIRDCPDKPHMDIP